MGSESRRHASARRRIKVSIVIPTFEKDNLKEDIQTKSKARSRSRETVIKTSASEQLSSRKAKSYSRAITALDETDHRQEISNLRVRKLVFGPMMNSENFMSFSDRHRVDNILSHDKRIEPNKTSILNVLKRPRSVCLHRKELPTTYLSAPKPQLPQRRPMTGSPLVKKTPSSAVRTNMMKYMTTTSTVTTQQDNSDLTGIKYVGIHQGTAAPFNLVYKKVLGSPEPVKEKVLDSERREYQNVNNQLVIDYQSISQSMHKVRLTNQLFETLLQDRDEHVSVQQPAYQTETRNNTGGQSIVSFRKSMPGLGLVNLKNIRSASGDTKGHGNTKVVSRETSHNVFVKRKKIPLSNYPMNTNVLLSNLMRDNLRMNK